MSWLALFGERVWEALLWPFLVVAAFLVVSLLELWSLLPPLMHRLVLGGFGLALIVSFLPLVRLSLPTRQEALRRLERHAGIKHRPASSYEDHLSTTPAKETAALWAVHRTRLSRLIARLKPSWPAPRTDREDPYAIRAALLLAVVAALVAARRQCAGSPARRLHPRRLDTARAAQARRLGDAAGLYRRRTDRAGRRQREGRRGRGVVPRLSVPERSELIVRTHAPQGETVSLTTSQDGMAEAKTIEPKTGGSEGLVEFTVPLTEPLSADVKISGADRVQMAVRADQGRSADHQSDGHPDHHAARRLAPGVPRRRR